jgi:NAD(P)-dependent dehydrogenase (short-subunit alcohol dehydrogenase family)
MTMAWSNVRYDFSGARVVVTGGTAGIGAGIAEAFAEAGANVTITGTRNHAGEYDIDLSRYAYQRLDVEDSASIDALAEAVQGCDILVNNAGLSFFSLGLDEREPDVFDRAIRIHLTAPFRLVRRLADKLAASKLPGGGCVIGIGSITSFMGMSQMLGYGAGKTGLTGMTRGLATDLGPRGIRLNVVAAGMVESRMTAQAFAPDSAWVEPTLARTPLGRLGQAADVAGPVLFLCSDAASWITGQVLMADGGYTISG